MFLISKPPSCGIISFRSKAAQPLLKPSNIKVKPLPSFKVHCGANEILKAVINYARLPVACSIK
jgi:hypothetical protein